MATKKLPSPSSRRAKRFGPLVIKTIVPRFYKDLTAIQIATGFAYSTIHDWSTGIANPKLDQLEKIAELTKVSVVDLLRGTTTPTKGTLQEHPEWDATLAIARAKYGRRLPDYAFELAGETSAARAPEHLDAEFVADLAQFWQRHAPDDESAETIEANRLLDDARAKKVKR